MSGLFGSVGEFKEGEEDWPQYAERVQHYFTANGVAEGKKVSVFLSIIGAKEYKLVSSLVAPSKPSDKTYGELVQVLNPRRCFNVTIFTLVSEKPERL